MSTREKIVDAAIDLFFKLPYAKVSLLQITKNANVSNGIIYKYFKNKEELFKYLLEVISERIETKLEDVKGETIESKLKSYIQLNVAITQEEKNLLQFLEKGNINLLNMKHELKKHI